MHRLNMFIKNVLFFTLIMMMLSALISCGSFENKQENKREVSEPSGVDSGEIRKSFRWK